MSLQEPSDDWPSVPWPDLVKFVRQLGHDIRNNLNAVELQSAFLGELAEEGELKGEIQRLREMVSGIGTTLQKLSAGLSQANPTLISYQASDFVEDLKHKVKQDFPDAAGKVNWDVQLKDEKLQLDPQLAQQAFLELFANAFHHERDVTGITAKAYIQNGRFVFELHEPKARFEHSTANWGREPLRHLSQGHYGLGLNRTRAITEAHGGNFGADYEQATSMLVTKVILPVTREGASS
jgi:light-regulated signal transduction histidine kinase (bacteriophytochrome)